MTLQFLWMTSPTKFQHMIQIVDVFMWPKFGNSSISMREIITTFLFEGWSWLKFNNLGPVIRTNLKFCTSMAKRLNLKDRSFWELAPTFSEVTEEKLVWG